MTATETPQLKPARRRLARRTAWILGVTLLLLGYAAGPAQAHVDVSGDAAPGRTALLTFRVPSESPTSATTEVTITLPTDTPLASVQAQQIPGWTATLTTVRLPKPITTNNMTITEAVGSVTFKADAGFGLQPRTFGLFRLLAGPLPDLSELAFPTVQTYDDGTSVTWDQPESPNGEEPNYPVPSITLNGQVQETPSGADRTTAPTVTAQTVDMDATTAQVISIVALVLAGAAVLVASIAWRNRLRPTVPATGTAATHDNAVLKQPADTGPKDRPE